MSKNKPSRLMALSAAAAALPGVSPVANASPPTEQIFGYRYSQYRESDVKESEVLMGSRQRYEIDVHQLSYSGPLSDDFSLSVNYQDEVLSGATPWATVANGDEIQVIMSGATDCSGATEACLEGIDEHRTDGGAALTYHYTGGTVTGNAAFSTEDDYESVSYGLSWQGEYDDKQTVVGTGFSVSDDEIDPEDGARLFNITNQISPGVVAKKDSKSLFFSVSRITSAHTLVLGGFSYTKKEGYLHDAYKLNDQRPDSKEMVTLNVSVRHYIKRLKAAFHGDIRYYDDDWGVGSYTYTTALHRRYDKLMVIPSFRYYTQNAANFYSPVAQTSNNFFADDARLSAFGAYTLGIKFEYDRDAVKWIADLQYYYADHELSTSSRDVPEHPGLIQYTRFTIGANYTF